MVNSIWILGVLVKTEEFMVCKLKVKKKNCKIELLKLSGYLMRVLQVIERSLG